MHGDQTSGVWEISFMVYIPSGQAGYFNTMSQFVLPGTFEWGMECYFDAGGAGRVFGGSATAVNFSYTVDTWQEVIVMVDLDNDWAQFYLDGVMIHEWQWTLGASGGGAILQLAANDFFGATANDQMYFDNFEIAEVREGFFDDFEDYTAGTQLVAQNSTDWTTWSNSPGSAEDPFVSNAQAYSGSNSVNITGTNDLVYPIPDLTEGEYTISFYLYVPTGADAYFNTLQDFAGASSQWGMQVYFGEGGAGAGSVDAGAAAAATFTFSYDTWIYNEVVVDLNSDFAAYFIDGTPIVSWVWSTGIWNRHPQPAGRQQLLRLGCWYQRKPGLLYR
jgi:hypothetical protein